MYFNSIANVTKLTFKLNNNNFISPYQFYLNSNCKRYYSTSNVNTCVSKKEYVFQPFYNFNNRLHWRTNIIKDEAAAIVCRSKKNNVALLKDKPTFYILLSFAGGSVRGKNESFWDTEREIAQKIQEAKSAIEEGNVIKGKEILENIILTYGKEKEVYVGLPCVFEMLATILYKNGELEKAQALLMTVVEKMLRSGMKNTDNIITNFTLKIARLYEEQEYNDLAELGYKSCVALQKHKYLTGQTDEETGLLWINSLFWYGKFLETKKRFIEAKQCFHSCYTLSAHVKKIQPTQIMVILYNLGEMAAITGDLDDAQRHYLNAIILGRDCNTKDLPIYYVKLGLMNLYKGMNEQAFIWCDFARLEAKRKKDKEIEGEAIRCIQQLKSK